MAEPAGPAPHDDAPTQQAVTHDSFFGGRLRLAQPVRGHRSGTDAVLLAAAAPRDFAGHALDVGAGVGAAGLGFAVAAPAARVTLVERDPFAAALAEQNIVANGLRDRADVEVGDVLRSAAAPCRRVADLVLTNPPFFDASRTRGSPDEARRRAHVLDAGASLSAWLCACLDRLAGRGTLIVVHAPWAIPEMLETFRGRAGAVTIKGVHPRSDAPARRVLVRAVKNSRAPLTLAVPLVLHAGQAFTPAAELIHRGESALDW